jgi:hypothetical protein
MRRISPASDSPVYAGGAGGGAAGGGGNGAGDPAPFVAGLAVVPVVADMGTDVDVSTSAGPQCSTDGPASAPEDARAAKPLAAAAAAVARGSTPLLPGCRPGGMLGPPPALPPIPTRRPPSAPPEGARAPPSDAAAAAVGGLVTTRGPRPVGTGGAAATRPPSRARRARRRMPHPPPPPRLRARRSWLHGDAVVAAPTAGFIQIKHRQSRAVYSNDDDDDTRLYLSAPSLSLSLSTRLSTSFLPGGSQR